MGPTSKVRTIASIPNRLITARMQRILYIFPIVSVTCDIF